MKPITVIGKNSYLAQHFLATAAGRHAAAISHDEFRHTSLSGTRCIINFAYPRAYMSNAYEPGNDMDRRIVDAIADSDTHYVMLSSRKVYDRTQPCPWHEMTALAGQDVYGRNKIITERHVRERLADRHTIVRLGNVIETAPGRHTFLSIALSTLKNANRIELDTDPESRRDFLPLSNLVAALGRIVELRPVGIYNLASGLGTAVGDVAAWIVEGFGSGQVATVNHRHGDDFVLDISRLQSIIGPICSRDEIRAACIKSGRILKNG